MPEAPVSYRIQGSELEQIKLQWSDTGTNTNYLLMKAVRAIS